MRVDYLSDIHINNWVSIYLPEYAQRKGIRELIVKILPSSPSEILVIAGDLGHENDQTKILLEILREFYKIVLWNEGNHDLYLFTETKEKYGFNSFNRLKEMVELSNQIENVFYLSGTKEIDGKVFGGFPTWYDMSYGVEVCFRSPIYIKNLWKLMPCARLIYTNGKDRPKFDWLKYAQDQKSKLEDGFRSCDLIFGHVSPDWSRLKSHHQDEPFSTFFHFDGRKILEECEGKTWIFGHTHERYDYFMNGCHLLCNPLGYPGHGGFYEERNFEGFSILTVEI